MRAQIIDNYIIYYLYLSEDIYLLSNIYVTFCHALSHVYEETKVWHSCDILSRLYMYAWEYMWKMKGRNQVGILYRFTRRKFATGKPICWENNIVCCAWFVDIRYAKIYLQYAYMFDTITLLVVHSCFVRLLLLCVVCFQTAIFLPISRMWQLAIGIQFSNRITTA